MIIYVFKDKLIKETEYKALCTEYQAFIQEHTGITPTYITKEWDFTTVPTETDSDGDLKPTMPYRKSLAEIVKKEVGEFGADHIIPLVHQDNWVFTGIWGTNWSNMFYSYHMSLCRFDKRNPANSLGTIYHEMMHSLDALIYTEIGKWVDVGVAWDKFCVHGGRPDKEGTTEWKYIRHKENTKALKAIAPDLQKAYAKRRERQRNELLATRNALASQVLELLKGKLRGLRVILAKKDGVPRG